MSLADKPVYPTLRQHFAILALQGILANDFNDRIQYSEYVYHCECAVKYADALLKELEKQNATS